MALARFSFEADGITIIGEGVVTITGAPGPDDHKTILEFLDAVDPILLEQQALARMGWGDTSLAATIVQLLREAITGPPAGETPP